jgi:hypothetical protein
MSIVVELAAPQSVNGERAAWQSLWLLVRLHYLYQSESGSAVLRLSELRQQFPDTRNLRMFISRAFKDFTNWGIRVGWGVDISRDPRFLNPDGRSQGPFWLQADERDRVRCQVDGQPASMHELREFLGIEIALKGDAEHVASRHNFDFWLALGNAQQALREGRFLATLGEDSDAGDVGGNGALAGFKNAEGLAQNHLQKSMAVLGEAGVWRRLDDLATARRTLAKLRRAVKSMGPGDNGYLDAMEQVLSAWCAYSQRDLPGTEAILSGMRTHAARDMVVRFHPRVRFEWHNLRGLVDHAHALGSGDLEHALRIRHADAALEHFDKAMQAAFELGSFDAAQQVAANTGLAIWLFNVESLQKHAPTQTDEIDALRWLMFSEWLCRCAGIIGHSAWNAIYLMRIARAKCPRERHPALGAFRRYRPVTPHAVAGAVAAGMEVDLHAVIPSSWHDLARQLYKALQHGTVRYHLLQRCGLLLEYGWFATHEGNTAAAAAALVQLRKEMRALPPSDRSFFADSLECLPQEVLNPEIK